MRQRLFNKYFFSTAVIVVLTLTFMMMILTFVYNDYLADIKYTSLEKTCDSVSDFSSHNVSDLQTDADRSDLYYIINNLAGVTDMDVFITDTSGIIRVCGCDAWISDKSCDHTGTMLDIDEINRIAKKNKKGLGNLGIYTSQHFYSSKELYDSNHNSIGYVVAAAPVALIRSLMKKIARLYLLSAIIPIIAMFFAIYGITYRMTKPLKLMSEAAKSMAKGDFSKRIPITSDDEIGELAISFNQMTNSLSRLEETRKSFIANVSHELKTPMTTIGGFIDGIIDGTIEPDKQNYYLSIVSDEIKRLSRMVQSMLNLARLESSEFVLKTEKFDFKELLLGVVISQEQRVEKQQLNIVGLDEIESVTIEADKDLIYRVVYNLVDNAIKFTDENGTISFLLRVDSKNMIFKITNTGHGIAENELPFVFERFYKIDKSRSANKKSTGLGLYIVKTIVKNHSGNITVSSKQDEFTSFEVTLPLNR